METVTFEIKMPYAEVRAAFGSWRCRIERADKDYTDLTFFEEREWKKFEEYADEKGIEYRLV